jgi:muconolactone delta-isomerase
LLGVEIFSHSSQIHHKIYILPIWRENIEAENFSKFAIKPVDKLASFVAEFGEFYFFYGKKKIL